MVITALFWSLTVAGGLTVALGLVRLFRLGTKWGGDVPNEDFQLELRSYVRALREIECDCAGDSDSESECCADQAAQTATLVTARYESTVELISRGLILLFAALVLFSLGSALVGRVGGGGSSGGSGAGSLVYRGFK
ncbi:MAG TPA: hypothetical protein VIV60_08580 [Polyangiaceae bacterium]